MSYLVPHSWRVSFSTGNCLGLEGIEHIYALSLIELTMKLEKKNRAAMFFFGGGVNCEPAKLIHSFETCCAVGEFFLTAVLTF